METRPEQNVNAFFKEGCSISASRMFTRLAFSTTRHTPFVRLPAERTKVVTMGAPFNKYGLEMSLFFICLKLSSGLSDLRCKSAGCSSASAEHKATFKSSWSSSFDDADQAIGRALEIRGCEWSWAGLLLGSLLRDLDLENSLGGEREGRVGEERVLWWRDCWGIRNSWGSMDCWGRGVLLKRGLLRIFWWWLIGWLLLCWGLSWSGFWDWLGMKFFLYDGVGLSTQFFYLCLPTVSALLKFVLVSISSGCSPSVFFFLTFSFVIYLLVDVAGCGADSTDVVTGIFSGVVVSVVLAIVVTEVVFWLLLLPVVMVLLLILLLLCSFSSSW